MQQSLFIRYVGCGPDDSQIPLADLGVSLMGIERAYQDLAHALGIKAELEFSARSTNQGSLIIQTVVTLSDTLPHIFSSNQELLDFLKIEGAESLAHAKAILNEIKDGASALEDYYAQRPISLLIIVGCLNKLWGLLLKLGKELRESGETKAQLTMSGEIPEAVLRKLLVALRRRGFRDALRPIINDAVKEIAFDTDPNFKTAARITEKNFQDLLSEEDVILPELKDGNSCSLKGRITSIKGTRGDSLTFHYEATDGRVYNLEMYPDEGRTTKYYISYYKEDIQIHAEVLRASLYKKPKLKLIRLEKIQSVINFDPASSGPPEVTGEDI